MSHEPVTMVIDTAFGVVVRTVAGASPLPTEIQGGVPAEDATHETAVRWGLPDFLYRATVRAKGSGSREIGDRLLVIQGQGVVIQVKRRENATDNEARERAWLAKNARTALNQAHGTIRALRSAPLTLTNGRDRAIELDGEDVEWLALAILDHPDPPLGVVPETEDGPNPALVLLRRDWEFLFRQLKSSHAVVQYFQRVVGEPWELGAEPSRYFQLATADAHAEPHPIRTDVLGRQGRIVGGPLLPLEPAGTGTEETPHLVLRAVMEDIAIGTLGGLTEENRLSVLGELDRLGVAQRAGIGTYLLDGMELAAKEEPGQVVWRQREFVSATDTERPIHLGFATCSHPWDAAIRGMFSTWVSLRHHQLWESLGRPEHLMSIGVAITPRLNDTLRPWDTSMVAVNGDLGLEADQLAEYEKIWPLPQAA